MAMRQHIGRRAWEQFVGRQEAPPVSLFGPFTLEGLIGAERQPWRRSGGLRSVPAYRGGL